MQEPSSQPPHDLLKTLRGKSASERQLHRLHSVALVMAGFSAVQVGHMYGDSPRAVAYWVERFKASGLAAMQERVRSGRPSRLNPLQMEELKSLVRQSGKKSKSINANTLAEYIKKTFKISYTTRQCWRILKQLAT